MDTNYCFTCKRSYASMTNLNRHFRTEKHEHMSDYAHCADCDRVINLDIDIWTADKNDTFCEICTKERKIIARI